MIQGHIVFFPPLRGSSLESFETNRNGWRSWARFLAAFTLFHECVSSVDANRGFNFLTDEFVLNWLTLPFCAVDKWLTISLKLRRVKSITFSTLLFM